MVKIVRQRTQGCIELFSIAPITRLDGFIKELGVLLMFLLKFCWKTPGELSLFALKQRSVCGVKLLESKAIGVIHTVNLRVTLPIMEPNDPLNKCLFPVPTSFGSIGVEVFDF
jgi:hypothetical protein